MNKTPPINNPEVKYTKSFLKDDDDSKTEVLGSRSRENKLPANSLFGDYATFVTVWMMMSIVGYQFTYLNPALPALQIVFNGTYMERYGVPMSDITWLTLLTVSTTAVIIGGFIGTLISKPLIDLMSRKRLMQVCHITQLVGVVVVSLIGGLTKSYEAFIIGRLIIGLPCGVVFNIGTVMVAELSCVQKQKFWQSFPASAMNFGIICAVVAGHPMVLGTTQLWPVAASLSVVPSLIYLISSIFIPNTPFYLMRSGKEEEALKALTVLRSGPTKIIEEEFEEISNKVKSEEVVSIRDVIAKKKYRRMLALVVALYSNLILCGVNSVSLYSDIIFVMAGIPPEHVTYISIGVFVLGFTSTIAGIFIVQKVRLKKFLLLTNIGLILVMSLYTVSLALSHLAPTVMQYLTVVSVAVYMVLCTGCLGVCSFAIIALITTEATRPSVLGIGTSIFAFSSWLTGFVAPYLMNGLGSYALIPWTVITIFMTIFFHIFLPNTGSKTEERELR